MKKKNQDFSLLDAGGKPSTWFPPGRLVELIAKQMCETPPGWKPRPSGTKNRSILKVQERSGLHPWYDDIFVSK